MEKIYYSIKEVSEMLKLSQSQLRFWEKEFEQLSPKRNAKQTRFYTQADIDVIKQIQFLLGEQKLTIAGAKERLKTNKDDVERRAVMREKLLRIRTELLNIRRELNQNEALAEEVIVK